MLSSDSCASPQQPLQNLQINNESNHGIIGGGSNNIVTSGNNNQFSITLAAEREDVELDKLLDGYVSKDAPHDSFHSPPECYPYTRTTIRDEISGWLDESVSEKSPLLWLNGPAAVGKSVIAKTISGFHDQIVATFFFSTSSDKTAATLFPTLAWQLAQRIPDTRKHIIASLKKSSQTRQIEEQFNRLIIQPLKSITALGSRPVMVIDGVDECTDENMLVRFLQVLVQAGEAGDMPIRFIICSRLEPRIHTILGGDRDVNPTNDEPELQAQSQKLDVPSFVRYLFEAFLVGFGMVGSFGLFKLIRMFGILQLLQNTRKYGIFYLFRLINRSAEDLFSEFFGIFGLIIGSTVYFGLVLYAISLAGPRSEARLPIPIQRSRGFLHDAWELFGSIRLDVDILSTSDRLADTFDKICPHPVISTIRIGFSQECREDMTRYLTDKFNVIRQPGYGTSPWFQPSDISNIVEASCGQFLYVSTIVRLLDDPHFSPKDVLEMAHCSSLPTPDLDELYKVILKRAQKDSPNYELVVKDSLAILVFFAGNVHFLTVRKNVPIIEFLLGLEKGKLSNKLCKMHSVLSIAPGDSIGVYHRSFLEFLLDRKRSGEYHISYSNGLQRILILMIQAGFRYNIMLFIRQSRDDDGERLGLVHDMIIACRHNFYGRSRFSGTLFCLHGFVHLLICSLLNPFLGLDLEGNSTFSRLVGAMLLLSLPGTFIISLIIYTFFLNRSIIVPFFHPFLHPLFVSTAGFLFASRVLLLSLLVVIEARYSILS